uniref:Uncharacterized protein n=2 Tax=Caenorhabditis japonica TaxID=281687 RepID=A0A8R1EHZ5_CAEJA
MDPFHVPSVSDPFWHYLPPPVHQYTTDAHFDKPPEAAHIIGGPQRAAMQVRSTEMILTRRLKSASAALANAGRTEKSRYKPVIGLEVNIGLDWRLPDATCSNDSARIPDAAEYCAWAWWQSGALEHSRNMATMVLIGQDRYYCKSPASLISFSHRFPQELYSCCYLQTSSSSWVPRASHHSLTIIAPYCHRGYGHTIDNALSRRHHSRTLRLLTSTLISARGSSLSGRHTLTGRPIRTRPPTNQRPPEPSGTTTPILTTIKGDDFPH